MDDVVDFVSVMKELGWGALKEVPQASNILARVSSRVCTSLLEGGKTVSVAALSSLQEMSVSQALLVGGGTTYVGYKLATDKHLREFAFKPTWSRLRMACGFTPRMEIDTKIACRSSRTQMESRREGSEEVPMLMPKYQAAVGYYHDGVYRVHGNCVRIDVGAHVFLLIPEHVFCQTLETEVIVRGPLGTDLDIKGKDYRSLGTDLLAVEISAQEASRLGLRKPVLHRGVPATGVYSKIVGPHNKGTTGPLKDDCCTFGRVVYDGTTLGGYSGAAYTIGEKLAGIHQAGGHQNSGFNAQYLYVVLKGILKIVEEDSEDWLNSLFEDGDEVEIDMSYQDEGRTRIKVKGVYHDVEDASMDKAFGAKAWRGKGRFRREPRRDYVDESDPRPRPQGEYRVTQLRPGASSLPDDFQERDQAQFTFTMEQFSRLSKRQKNNFRNTVWPHRNQTSTSGQEGERVISIASPCTQASTSSQQQQA